MAHLSVIHLLNWRSEFIRLEGAYAPATMRAYYADVTLFVKWCKANTLPPFPATPSSVSRFLEEQSQEKSISTVKRRLYSIRKAHQLLRLPDPTTDQDVFLTLRRIRRSKLSRPRQAKGLTQDYLQKFIDVQPDTLLGLRNRAMLALGYDLLTRRSELVALNVQDLLFREDGTMKVLIRRSKADPFGQGRLAFASHRTTRLVEMWIGRRGPEIEPLFCPVYHGVPIDRCLSVTTVKRIIKSSARDIGLPEAEVNAFSGHSMRVGAAQDLLTKGLDTAAIMRAGGWKSLNVLARYLEHAEHNVWT
ncbi:MAG: tyrosine-type recombinase/integrase [Rhodobacteraceae bacterium]|nr:tyrosine-type recombinase/integrase [Paracoccaceae bacterium]